MVCRCPYKCGNFRAYARIIPTFFPTACIVWLDLLGLGISDITMDCQECMEEPMHKPFSVLPLVLLGN